MSWLLPANKSASDTLPVGPSKTYSFSTLTQGSWRRCRFIASRSFENFFSFTRSFLRAAIHSFCETTLRFSTPWKVLISGMMIILLPLALPQPEPADEFLRLRKRPIGHHARLPGKLHPRACRSWMQPLQRQQHPGLSQLLVVLAHRRHEFLARQLFSLAT